MKHARSSSFLSLLLWWMECALARAGSSLHHEQRRNKFSSTKETTCTRGSAALCAIHGHRRGPVRQADHGLPPVALRLQGPTARSCSLPVNSFDLVLHTYVLHEMAWVNDFKVATERCRVLKPRARFRTSPRHHAGRNDNHFNWSFD